MAKHFNSSDNFPLNKINGGEFLRGSVQVDKRGKKPRYYIKLYDRGQQITISVDKSTNSSFTSKAQANRALTVIQKEIEQGVFNRDQWKKNKHMERGLTFRQYKRQWLKKRKEMCESGLIVPRTLKDETTHVEKYIDPKFGNIPLVSILPHAIEVFYAKLPLSDAGKYNVIATFRKIMRDANEDRILATVPKFPKLGRKKSTATKQFMIPADQDRVIAKIPEADQPIFHMLRQYGLRPGEARAIHKSSIRNGELFIEWSFSENLLRNTTKTGDVVK